MTSSVFFKFKSQKEPTRVEFDGTGISVFELKRDIILKSGLGDGTDFDLAIYADDGDEYDDDTTIIPRSTTVVARRLPPLKPGAGRAARYVSGKMPVTAKNASRREQVAKASAKATSNALTQMSNAMTEEEKIEAMFAAQTEQWNAQQEEMSHQVPVFKGPGAKRPANVPDHPPPTGYICYRCGEKGHWIQLCPTNNDPEFDNRPRVKRTTGIPRSFLKTVDKAAILAQAAEDGTKAPSGIMVNADGDFVTAEPDKVAWEKFQAKAQQGAAAKEVAALADKELKERGLECPIDQKLFIEPMKTPCCAKTYCNDCITNALIESDFVCPGCSTEGVLIDDLKADEETEKKIAEYQAEKRSKDTKVEEESKSPVAEAMSPPAEDVKSEVKAEESGDAEKPKSPLTPKSPAKAASPPKETTDGTVPRATSVTSTTSQTSKKRPAEEPAENPRIPKGPKAMQKQQGAQDQQQMMQQMMNGMPNMNGMMPFPMGMPNMNGMPGFGMGMPNMNMPGFGMGMPNMNMPPMPGMNMGMMNPMMNPMMGMNGFNGMNGMNGGFGGPGPNGPQQNWGGMNGQGGNMGAGRGNMGMMNGRGGFNGNNMHHNNGPGGNFNNQAGGADDGAYFRQPVNPHRHQNRAKRVRPSDFTELGN